jgi:hypothetical protein
MKQLFFALCVIVFASSCHLFKENRRQINRMIALLERRNITFEELEKLTRDDTRCSAKKLEERKIACNKLTTILIKNDANNPEDDNMCVECNTLKFCGVEQSELKTNIEAYIDNVWSVTSSFTGARNYSQAEYQAFASNAITNDWALNAPKLDAQFMDVSVDDMKNYLCAIDNIDKTQNVNTLRFYYIRYKNTPVDPTHRNWKDCHSICIVPTQVSTNPASGVYTMPGGEMLDKVEYNKKAQTLVWDIGANCSRSAMSNHNAICPPLTGCNIKNTILQTVFH